MSTVSEKCVGLRCACTTARLSQASRFTLKSLAGGAGTKRNLEKEAIGHIGESGCRR